MKPDNVDMESLEEILEIEIVRGVGGDCLVINDTRVAGAKPLGGGTVTHRWAVPIRKIPALQHQEQVSDLADEGLAVSEDLTNPPLQALINKAVEKYLTDSFGPRCNTRDIEDISAEDLGDSRCIVCQQWEYYDEWVDTQGERLKELRDKA